MEEIQGVLDLVEQGEISKPKKVFLGFEFEIKEGGSVTVRKFFQFVYVRVFNPKGLQSADSTIISVTEDATVLFETIKAQYNY